MKTNLLLKTENGILTLYTPKGEKISGITSINVDQDVDYTKVGICRVSLDLIVDIE